MVKNISLNRLGDYCKIIIESLLKTLLYLLIILCIASIFFMAIYLFVLNIGTLAYYTNETCIIENSTQINSTIINCNLNNINNDTLNLKLKAEEAYFDNLDNMINIFTICGGIAEFFSVIYFTINVWLGFKKLENKKNKED